MSSSRGLFRSGNGRLAGSSHFARSGAGWSGKQPRALRVMKYASSFRQIDASSGLIPNNKRTPSIPSGSRYPRFPSSTIMSSSDRMMNARPVPKAFSFCTVPEGSFRI